MIPTLGGGGAERMMVQLANGLFRAGVNVELVTVLSTDDTLLPEVEEGVPIFHLRAGRQRHIPCCFRRYVAERKPDIVISALMSNWTVFSGMMSKPRPKLVITERSTLSAVVGGQGTFLAKALFLASRFFYPLADSIVAVSKASADDLVDHKVAPRDKVRVIYNPVVTERFVRWAAESPALDLLLAGHPNFVAVGRFSWEKDYPIMIEAFAILRATRLCRLIIFGEGALRPELEAQISRLGLKNDILLPGFVRNPFPYVKAANCLVSSSRVEGLPGALIQALACGANVVATDCPGGSAEVLDGGRYGRLVRVGDPEALAGAMKSALDDPLDAQVLRKRAEVFSERGCIDAYIELFRELSEK